MLYKLIFSKKKLEFSLETSIFLYLCCFQPSDLAENTFQGYSLFCQPDKSYAELFFGVSLDSEDEEDDDPLEHIKKVHHLQNIQL